MPGRGIRLASGKHGVLNDGGDHGNGGSGDREVRTRLSTWQDPEKWYLSYTLGYLERTPLTDWGHWPWGHVLLLSASCPIGNSAHPAGHSSLLGPAAWEAEDFRAIQEVEHAMLGHYLIFSEREGKRLNQGWHSSFCWENRAEGGGTLARTQQDVLGYRVASQVRVYWACLLYHEGGNWSLGICEIGQEECFQEGKGREGWGGKGKEKRHP